MDKNKGQIEQLFVSVPFWDLLGIRVVEVREGYAKLCMPFDNKLTQPYGIVHGGALFSLADSAGAVAVASLVGLDKRFVTVEMKINFLNPVREDVMEANAKVVKKGKTIAVSDICVENKEQIVAKAIATYIILDD
ncbi:MAG: thioesterase [Deltaproteobacteria bacterium]|nr:MAG: thioesterase [Deltaproteobacteria bacterium]